MTASLETGLPCGRLILKLAQTEDERKRVFQLRFKIFNEELGEGLPESVLTGLDRDNFDSHCDHLMVIDHGNVVGTFRLLHGPRRPAQGFYSQTEFDLSGLKVDPNLVVELGRGCIDPVHRKQTTLMGLFWGLHSYMVARKARYFLGCGSLPPMSHDDAEASFAAAQANGWVDLSRGITPLKENTFSGDATKGTPKIPPLVKLYVEFGSRILGRPAYDPVFRCHDMFLFFDMEGLTDWGRDLIARFDRRL